VNEIENQIRQEEKDLEHEGVQARNEHERIQLLREESFAREIAEVKEDRVAAKKLLQQRKQDAKIVHRIFKAYQSNDYYGVLGIRNFVFSNWYIPHRTVTIIPKYFVVNVPGFEIFTISKKKIKRAYREMVKFVHPDKSKDPRAVEAFLMVENAAAILLNEETRSEYDMIIQKDNRERRTRIVNQIRQGIERSLVMTNAVLSSARRLLGPLSIPFVVLVALIA
jgi:hypothetical protein